MRCWFLLSVLIGIWLFADQVKAQVDNTTTTTDTIYEVRVKRAVPVTNRPGHIDPQCRTCGVSASSTLQARVINGVPVKPRWKYPWILPMSVGGRPQFSCGGALITRNFVLTAAHCVRDPKFSKTRTCVVRGVPVNCFLRPRDITVAYMGESHNKPIGLMGLSYIHIHPQYDYWRSLNDIAILQLQRPVPQCNKYIAPLCLPPKPLSKLNQQVVVAGWGRSMQRRQNEGPQMLREGRVVEVDPTHCQRSNNQERRPEKIYCTIGMGALNQSSCQGDSGSSVFASFHGVFYSLGVTSQHTDSETCPIDKVVSFANTYGYLDFILPIVGALPQPPSRGSYFYGFH